MSPTIWMQCEGGSRAKRFVVEPWRVVEAQHVIATMKIVDTLEEQADLERFIEARKPPMPEGARFVGLHYLLATPFRYPPLAHGSRFGTHVERGIWYGADNLETALAETAYYRLLFFAGSFGKLKPPTVQLSAFKARVATRFGIDLTREPFAAHEGRISSPLGYTTSQALGREMRAAGVEAFRYRSARDPQRGANIGLFEPAFSDKNVAITETWICRINDLNIEFQPNIPGKKKPVSYAKSAFEISGALPSPAA